MGRGDSTWCVSCDPAVTKSHAISFIDDYAFPPAAVLIVRGQRLCELDGVPRVVIDTEIAVSPKSAELCQHRFPAPTATSAIQSTTPWH